MARRQQQQQRARGSLVKWSKLTEPLAVAALENSRQKGRISWPVQIRFTTPALHENKQLQIRVLSVLFLASRRSNVEKKHGRGRGVLIWGLIHLKLGD